MAIADKLVTDTHEHVRRILAQAEAVLAEAEQVEIAYQALGGRLAVAGYAWPDGLAEADFTAAVAAVQNLSTLLDASALAPLYKFDAGMG